MLVPSLGLPSFGVMTPTDSFGPPTAVRSTSLKRCRPSRPRSALPSTGLTMPHSRAQRLVGDALGALADIAKARDAALSSTGSAETLRRCTRTPNGLKVGS